MVRGEEAVATADEKMGEAEGAHGRGEEAPVAGGDALGRWPRPPHGGGGVARPHRGPGRSARGGHGGKRGRPSRWGRMGNNRGGGVEFVCPHLDDRGDAADATPLTSLLLSSSLSSVIAGVDVVGGVTSSVDANLDVVPATKEDVVDVDDDGATVAAVIATPDTTGGDDLVREVIVLELSLSTRYALIVLSLVMNTFCLVLLM